MSTVRGPVQGDSPGIYLFILSMWVILVVMKILKSAGDLPHKGRLQVEV